MSQNSVSISVVGAAGRMGRALIQAITENPRTVLCGALERDGSDAIGRDAGELAGVGAGIWRNRGAV